MMNGAVGGSIILFSEVARLPLPAPRSGKTEYFRLGEIRQTADVARGQICVGSLSTVRGKQRGLHF